MYIVQGTELDALDILYAYWNTKVKIFEDWFDI